MEKIPTRLHFHHLEALLWMSFFLRPWLKKIIWRLPSSIRDAKVNKPYILVIGIDENGKILHNLKDELGKAYYLTSVIEHNGELWLGSNKSNQLLN